jgi:SAM-dependent MidA family methyltransferase
MRAVWLAVPPSPAFAVPPSPDTVHASSPPLPDPSSDAREHGARVVARLHEELAAEGGWMPFPRYVELALYAPQLGYYCAGARKLGREGDFVTAPEISPLFGAALARQAAELVAQGLDAILEVGAGSGALAASMLEELARLDRLPTHYFILELSADLRERSRDTLAARVPSLVERVAWLNQLPPSFAGLVFGNEVLDAMPFAVVRVYDGKVQEAGVVATDQGFDWAWRPAGAALVDAAQRLQLPEGYQTEIGLTAQAFMRTLGATLSRGVVLFLDYGFPEREYYHPERSRGTFACHYRHRAHDDPFFLPGLQDITTHVDFTAIANAAHSGGLDLLGYTTQAHFLVNCGITDLLLRTRPEDAARYLPQSAAVQKLVSPAEMGELFKAIAFGRGFEGVLSGFRQGDRSAAL